MGPQTSEGVLYVRRGYVGRHAAYVYAAGKSAGGASEPSSRALWFGSAGAGASGCDEVVESRVDMGRTDAPLSIVYLAFGSAGRLLHRRRGRPGRAIWSGSPPSVAVQLSFRGIAPVYRMGGDKQLHTHSGHQNGSQGTRIMCNNSFFWGRLPESGTRRHVGQDGLRWDLGGGAATTTTTTTTVVSSWRPSPSSHRACVLASRPNFSHTQDDGGWDLDLCAPFPSGLGFTGPSAF